MPPKQQKEIVQAINSAEHFLELISPENKKLIGMFIVSNIAFFSDRYSLELVRPMRSHEPELQNHLVQLRRG